MTRYAFISHMEDYLKKLISDPLKADTDDFLKAYGIDGPKAVSILTKRYDPNDENSAVVIKSTSIKDNGFDENGKKNKDTFVVKYKIPRKNYTRKMRNLYINLFESNIIEGSPLNEDGACSCGACAGGEGATSAADSGQFIQPLGGVIRKKSPVKEDRKTLYITEEQAEYIKEATASNVSANAIYDVPMSKGHEGDKFYREANDHKDIMRKSWPKQ